MRIGARGAWLADLASSGEHIKIGFGHGPAPMIRELVELGLRTSSSITLGSRPSFTQGVGLFRLQVLQPEHLLLFSFEIFVFLPFKIF